MDRAQEPTHRFYLKMLIGATPTPRSPVVGGTWPRRLSAKGDDLAAWHLATSAEAADRGLEMRSSEWYCTPVSGEWINQPLRSQLPDLAP